jgi:hypothetical protein
MPSFATTLFFFSRKTRGEDAMMVFKAAVAISKRRAAERLLLVVILDGWECVRAIRFLSSLSLSLSFCAICNDTHKQNTSDGIYCVIFSTRERLWNEFKAEVTDRCVSLST